MDLRTVFNSMISVSELGRGQASKVIQAVEDEGTPYIVVKNNKPQAVIISINEYLDLMKAKDICDSLQAPAQDDYFRGFPAEPSYAAGSAFPRQRPETLTTDEINIFLSEEND